MKIFDVKQDLLLLKHMEIRVQSILSYLSHLGTACLNAVSVHYLQ